MRRFRIFRLRYSLATFLVVLTLFALVIGLYAASARRQRLAVAKLELLGASVSYDGKLEEMSYPKWLTDRLGIDYFLPVIYVQLHYRIEDRHMVSMDQESLQRAVEAIKQLPKVDYIYFAHTGVRDEDLALLAPLAAQIEVLHFNESWNDDLTGAGFEHLANWTRLHSIWLNSRRLDTKSIGHLTKLPALMTLRIKGELAEETFTDIGRLEHLTTLGLYSSSFDGRWLAELSKAPKLKSISLISCKRHFQYMGLFPGELTPGKPFRPDEMSFMFRADIGEISWPRDLPILIQSDMDPYFDEWMKRTLPNVKLTEGLEL